MNKDGIRQKIEDAKAATLRLIGDDISSRDGAIIEDAFIAVETYLESAEAAKRRVRE